MRTYKFFVGVISATVLTALVFQSCQKGIQSKNQTTSISDNNAANNFAGLLSLANTEDARQFAIATDPSVLSSIAPPTSSCPPITTYDNPPGVYPRTVTINWGTGCTNADGITRAGKTITYYSADMSVVGSFFKTTYDSFYLNGVHIEGQVKWSHNARNNGANNLYSMTLKNRKITQTNGDYIIYNGSRRVVKKDTVSAYPGFPNGWFRLTGSVSGDEVKGGVPYQWKDSIDAANPLIYNFCSFIVKGNLHVDFTGNPSATTWDVNYGTGTCDNQATLSVDGGPFNSVTLPLDF